MVHRRSFMYLDILLFKLFLKFFSRMSTGMLSDSMQFGCNPLDGDQLGLWDLLLTRYLKEPMTN